MAAAKDLSTFNKIKILYELNANKIVMPDYLNGTHTINFDNLTYWQKMMNEYDKRKSSDIPKNFYTTLAKIVVSNIKYISFDNFYAELKLLANDLLTKMIANKLEYKYVFVTGGKYNKSNTWVFLLIFGCIYKSLMEEQMEDLIYVNAINSDIERSILYDIIEKNKQIMFIYVDDMIYSGTQTANSLSTVINEINQNIERTHSKRNDIHFIAINYLTTKAKKNLESIHPVKYSTISSIFPNICECIENYMPLTPEEVLVKTHISELSKKDLEALFEKSKIRISYNHIIVYFDHKIADDLSTITDILNFGYYPGSVEVELDSALINNCNKEYFKKTKSCINPYYKNITYTIGDRDIKFESLNTLDITVEDMHIKPEPILRGKNITTNKSPPKEQRKKLVLKKTRKSPQNTQSAMNNKSTVD